MGCFIANYNSGIIFVNEDAGVNLDTAAAGNTEHVSRDSGPIIDRPERPFPLV